MGVGVGGSSQEKAVKGNVLQMNHPSHLVNLQEIVNSFSSYNSQYCFN